MGYDVLSLSVKQGQLDDLPARLHHRTTLILGPSGAGKSSLINRLIPHAQAATGEISQALNSGRHTTTTTTWHWMDDTRQTALIDSPGFQEFGLAHMSVSELQHAFREFKDLLGKCRFHNCAHLAEPDCAVRAAVERNEIAPERLALFRQLRSDSKTADTQLQGISQAKQRWSALATKPSKR